MSDAAGAAVAKPMNDPHHELAVERAGRVGRRVGLAIYFVCLGYIVVVGFGTFIQGIFLAPVPSAGFDGHSSCEVVRQDLARELQRIATRNVVGDSPQSFSLGFAEWDDRYAAIRARCSDAPTRQLESVRHRVEIQLRRFERDNGAALRRLSGTPASTTAPESPR